MMELGFMLRKFKVTYNEKVYDSEAGGIITPLATGGVNYSLVKCATTVRAKTSKQAREKMRSRNGYSISSIRIEEVTSSWVKTILKWLKR